MLHYLQLLTDKNKSVRELPKEIRIMISTLNLPSGHLKKHPENKTKQEVVERQDLAITASIQSWLDTLEENKKAEAKKMTINLMPKIITFLIVMGFIYILISFTVCDFNPFQWYILIRFFYAVMALLISVRILTIEKK